MKMTAFSAVFEGNRCINKLCDLLGQFGEKDRVDF